MKTPKQALQELTWLEQEYPNWRAAVLDLLAVETGDPFKILVSTILSLRTLDQTTAQASQRLYAVADTPRKVAELSEKQLAKLIYPVGFYRTKSKQILAICRALLTEYHGQVPADFATLLSFPGVGRKTANLVMALAFGQPAICVDTHVQRISNRLQWVKTSTPEETEFALQKVFPTDKWSALNKIIVAFGQTICRPVSPKCAICVLRQNCVQ
ncbi:endonuclease III [Candidatus Termititenax persephonae]|uniref:Endonuclease III n=1 Tax=Candidatus Termititenax persephonae TaxID=2218525 RepID=A0A388THN7_9BACT|nr:endonuclease III [Candidatus Termititenax persephonae]